MAHVVVVGAGVIGSHLLPLLARGPRVSRLTIVDRDVYELTNLESQAIEPRDVGRPKAVLQARRMRRINPSLAVHPLHRAVEELPLGALRADLIVACLDSRGGRMTVNQAAWRLGVPWVDAGVEATGMLARVAAFDPAPDAPCLECGWDAGDYALVEQSYPCQAGATAPRTGASPALGALAAALQAIECDTLLAGATSDALVGRDVLIDARHHKYYLSARRRNPACRMPDHAGWRIDPFDGQGADMTLGDVLAIGTTLRDAGDRLALRVAGQRFATALTCARCGAEEPVFALERSLRRVPPSCRACAGELVPVGFALRDSVMAGAETSAAHGVPLAHLGVLTGDVLSLQTPSVEVHYELRGAR
jgi:molybdopterin/thiamine biosynthesis adenylyltransferase